MLVPAYVTETLGLVFSKVQKKLEALMSATVDVPGENNSILLIGPRGVGKTLVVFSARQLLT